MDATSVWRHQFCAGKLYACAHAADNSNWTAGSWGKTVLSTLKRIRLLWRAHRKELLWEAARSWWLTSSVSFPALFVFDDFFLISFSAPFPAGLTRYQACGSTKRVLANFFLMSNTERSCCTAKASRQHVRSKRSEATKKTRADMLAEVSTLLYGPFKRSSFSE